MSKFEDFKGPRNANSPRKNARVEKAQWNDAYDEGIIILKSQNSGSAAGLRRLAGLVAVFLTFKGFVIAYLGGAYYAQSIDKLSTGNLFEQAAAFLMFPDFASSTVASFLVQLVH